MPAWKHFVISQESYLWKFSLKLGRICISSTHSLLIAHSLVAPHPRAPTIPFQFFKVMVALHIWVCLYCYKLLHEKESITRDDLYTVRGELWQMKGQEIRNIKGRKLETSKEAWIVRYKDNYRRIWFIETKIRKDFKEIIKIRKTHLLPSSSLHTSGTVYWSHVCVHTSLWCDQTKAFLRLSEN